MGIIKRALVIREYLADIGRRGGRVSRRKLDPETARKMAKIREARRAYRMYHVECFWSYDPDLKIGEEDIHWVGEQLLKHGSLKCWKVGRALCQ